MVTAPRGDRPLSNKGRIMQAKLIKFGEIEIDGERYTKDVVIENGTIRKRDKGPSRPRKREFGHTPLTAKEAIPWDCETLIIGTGVHGRLPVLDDVLSAAKERGVEVYAMPTEEACAQLSKADLRTTNAIVHVTC